MSITLTAEFTMRRGRVPGALKLIQAVKRQAEAEQPGTLVYLVHRILDAKHQPTRKLFFYEHYQSPAAFKRHLASSSWQAVAAQWPRYFEGTLKTGIKSFKVTRLAAFARRGAIPPAP